MTTRRFVGAVLLSVPLWAFLALGYVFEGWTGVMLTAALLAFILALTASAIAGAHMFDG